MDVTIYLGGEGVMPIKISQRFLSKNATRRKLLATSLKNRLNQLRKKCLNSTPSKAVVACTDSFLNCTYVCMDFGEGNLRRLQLEKQTTCALLKNDCVLHVSETVSITLPEAREISALFHTE